MIRFAKTFVNVTIKIIFTPEKTWEIFARKISRGFIITNGACNRARKHMSRSLNNN